MLVSVLSLVYNHEPYLEDFFRGLLDQQHPYEWEIVIGVDQCSDHSLDICKKYRDQYPALIRLIIHEERVGIIPNFIATYEACTGKYIAMCEGDDYWIDPLKLSKQVQVLEADSEAVLCFTGIKVLDEEEGHFYPNWASISKERYVLKDVIQSNPISTCSVLFRNHTAHISKDSFKGLQMADWPLYVELLTQGYAVFLKEDTAVYRRNMGGSFAKNSIAEQLIKKKDALDYLIANPGLENSLPLLQASRRQHIYAIALRLPGNDSRKMRYLDELISPGFFRHMPLSAKALIRRFFFR